MTDFPTKTNYALSLLITLCFLSPKFTAAQLQDDDLKNVMESRNYAFTVTHESGGDFALGNYYLHVVNDSLSVALPYSGRSDQAAYTVDDNGINLQTKQFTYKETPTKKGGYDIRIMIKIAGTATTFSLHVNKKGIAMLTADRINREAQIYTGVVQNL